MDFIDSLLNNKTIIRLNHAEYRDPLIVFLMREPSIFRIAVSLFWLVIGSQIEIDDAALN